MPPRDLESSTGADAASTEQPLSGPRGVVRGDAPPPSTDPTAPRRTLNRTQRWAIRVGPWIVRALALTWRIRTYNESGWRTRRANRHAFLFALWHGDLLPLLAQHHDQGVVVLISEHRDGEVIAQIAHALGFRTVRGSTSRGAARALLAITRSLEDGNEVAVTPDGPRGPRHTFAPGALVAANRADVPVVAIGVTATRAWRLKSWDAFLIPKPFSRITIVYSDPTFVGATDTRTAGEQSARFEALMGAMGAQAEAAITANTATS